MNIRLSFWLADKLGRNAISSELMLLTELVLVLEVLSSAPYNPFSGKLGRNAISAELLQPAELVSGVICQVAAEPDLAALLANFLYSNEGASVPMHAEKR